MTGCLGSGSGSNSSGDSEYALLDLGSMSSESGRLKLASRSAPGEGASGTSRVVASSSISSAVIRITAIQIKPAGRDGWLRFQISPFELDLMQLNSQFNGLLAKASLPVGRYDSVRLITEEQGRLFLEDGTQGDLDVPSGSRSGLKVYFSRPIEIRAGALTVAAFEFDVSRSFVGTGRSYHFKPVIRPMCSEPIENPGSGSGGGSGSGEDTGGATPSPTPAPTPVPDDGSTGTIDPTDGGAVTPGDGDSGGYVPVLGA